MAELQTAKKKILVIEDELIVGRLCQRVLTGDGFEVDLVNNGLHARETAAEKTYDCCVSDIRLPGITGIDLYQHWKTGGNPLADRLIFITGDTLNNTTQDFLERSGTPCIMKPFTPEELGLAVQKALSPKPALTV
jgi:two-component system, NtrC family, sensor kinase